MCMFSRPVQSVAKTQICVIDGGLRQTTVYANRVELGTNILGMADPSAMILPVPCTADSRRASPDTCGITVHDMSAAKSFFAHLGTILPSAAAFGQEKGMARGAGGAPPIKVLRSGSYQYSIVPTVEDFARLERSVFGLSATSTLYGILARHYAAGFAFLVCIIDASAEFAPIAYTHDKHPSGRLFVPTRHFHGEPSSLLRAATYLGEVPTADEGVADDWNHAIYAIGAAADDLSLRLLSSHIRSSLWAYEGHGGTLFKMRDAFSHRTGFSRGLPFAVPELVSPAHVVLRTIDGVHANEDVWFTSAAHLATMAAKGKCNIPLTGPRGGIVQDVFTCLTCRTDGGLSATNTVCRACVTRCHAGHAVLPCGVISAFCDCGALGIDGGCLCLDGAGGAVASGSSASAAASGVVGGASGGASSYNPFD